MAPVRSEWRGALFAARARARCGPVGPSSGLQTPLRSCIYNPCGGPRGRRKRFRRSIAQWLEHRSPKPGDGGSSPSTPARRDPVGGVAPARSQSLQSSVGYGSTPEAAARYAMAKISPFKFLQEVRAEAQKVTWPTRRETAITTAMVFVMVAIAAVFFLLADQVMRMFVTLILGVGGG